MLVRELDEDGRTALHLVFGTWFGPGVQCSPGAFWPAMRQLEAAELVLVAEQDGESVGAVLADASGRIDWLLTKPGHTGPAFAALIQGVFDRCGDCWGRVENPVLRATYTAASPHAVETEGDPALLRWAP